MLMDQGTLGAPARDSGLGSSGLPGHVAPILPHHVTFQLKHNNTMDLPVCSDTDITNYSEEDPGNELSRCSFSGPIIVKNQKYKI